MRRAAAILCAAVLCLPVAVSADGLPFKAGERLVFKARWLWFDAGMIEAAVPEIAQENGARYARFTLHTWTTHTIAYLFSMDDYFESKWDVDRRVPKTFSVRIRESTATKDKWLEFDHAANTVSVTLNKEQPRTFDLAPLAQDFFSASFVTRAHKLEPKDKVLVPVFEDNKNYDAEIKVVKRERIPVMNGEVDTVMLKARLQFEGAFQDSRSLFIWLTDDDAHIPVKLSANLIFGTITLNLVEAEGVNLRLIGKENGK